LSFDTRLAQDSIAEPPDIFLGVNRHPHFLAGRGCFSSKWLPFPDRTSTNPAAFSLRITSAQVTCRA
jgi:hypothetical protein